MISRRTALLASAAALSRPAWAAGWPDRSIRLIVPFPAGGGVDTAARIYAIALSGLLKQQFVVDNRPGASGAIGAQAVAKAAPDGYTFLFSSPAEVMVSAIAGQQLPYNPQQDLVPVALAGETPLGIVAHPSVGVKDIQELIARNKAKKLQIHYGTPGSGSTMNFAGEALKASTGLNWEQVPYRGAAPAVNDVLGGQVECVISGLPPLVPHIKSRKLVALAVTSAKRSPLLPEVTAVSELPGLSDFRFTNWMGVFAPRGTPTDVVEQLGRAIASTAKDPAIVQRLQDAGLDASGFQGPAFEKFLGDERARYVAVAKKTTIKLD